MHRPHFAIMALLPLLAAGCMTELDDATDDATRDASAIPSMDDLRAAVLSWTAAKIEEVLDAGIEFACRSELEALLGNGSIDDFLQKRKTIMFYKGSSLEQNSVSTAYIEGTDTVWDLTRYQVTASDFRGSGVSGSIDTGGNLYDGLAFGGSSVLDYNDYFAITSEALPLQLTLGPFSIGPSVSGVGFVSAIDKNKDSFINPLSEVDWNGVYGIGIEGSLSAGMGIPYVPKYQWAFYETNESKVRALCSSAAGATLMYKSLTNGLGDKVKRYYCRYGTTSMTHEDRAILIANSIRNNANQDPIAGLVASFAVMIGRYRDSWLKDNDKESALTYACSADATPTVGAGSR